MKNFYMRKDNGKLLNLLSHWILYKKNKWKNLKVNGIGLHLLNFLYIMKYKIYWILDLLYHIGTIYGYTI